jgi:hypothetical protein
MNSGLSWARRLVLSALDSVGRVRGVFRRPHLNQKDDVMRTRVFMASRGLALVTCLVCHPSPLRAARIEPALRSGDIQGLARQGREEVLGAVKQGGGGAGFSAVIARPSARLALEEQELIRRVGEKTVAEIARREGGIAFLLAFLGDVDWLESFLVGEAPNASYGQEDVSPAKALENLYLLHHYGQNLDKPVYRRLATAMALKAGLVPYRLVARFKQIQAAHRQGLLHASFDTLDVREMGWAIYLGYGYSGTAGDTREYEYLLDDRQTKAGDYINACWAVWWLDFNVYGDWLQGSGFFTPWLHAFGCREEAARKVGGQCEDLSRYGWAVARAHGVMAGLAGQPGHCAYVVRIGEGWPIAYDVAGPAATDFRLPGWEGTTYATVQALYEPVQHDRTNFLAANRLTMLAKLLRAQAASPSEPPGLWKEAFAQATRVQPLNYRTWLEYFVALEETAETPPATWRELAGAAVEAFAPYHEAAWALAHRAIKKALPAMTPAQRLAFFADCHQKLRQEKARQFENYRFDHVLSWQADQLGDPATQLDYLARVLHIHAAPPPGDRLFSLVLDWGQNRFSKSDSKTAAQFAQIVGDALRDQGGEKDRMRSRFAKGLRTASERGDFAATRVWMNLAQELLPPLQPSEVRLSAEQARVFPEIKPFAGQLLSTEGLLRTSTTDPHDCPLSYGALLRGAGFGGFFHTAAEENPWAQVQLPGEALLSGITLVNRYESLAQNQVPLKLSVSTDGQSWTELASFLKSEPVFRLDLAGKKVQARFIRVERPATAGRRDAFHLRALLIYGQKLY